MSPSSDDAQPVVGALPDAVCASASSAVRARGGCTPPSLKLGAQPTSARDAAERRVVAPSSPSFVDRQGTQRSPPPSAALPAWPGCPAR
jgi:hypothetical protein